MNLDAVIERLNARLGQAVAVPVVDVAVPVDLSDAPDPTAPAYAVVRDDRRRIVRNDDRCLVELRRRLDDGSYRVVGAVTYEVLYRSAIPAEELLSRAFRIPPPPPPPPQMPDAAEFARLADAIRAAIREHPAR